MCSNLQLNSNATESWLKKLPKFSILQHDIRLKIWQAINFTVGNPRRATAENLHVYTTEKRFIHPCFQLHGPFKLPTHVLHRDSYFHVMFSIGYNIKIRPHWEKSGNGKNVWESSEEFQIQEKKRFSMQIIKRMWIPKTNFWNVSNRLRCVSSRKKE